MSVVPSRLRVVHRSFLTRRGGRHTSRAAVSVEYRPNESLDARVIDAEALHGDEQTFWGERRAFYRKPVAYFPTWDRHAQTLILLTRHVPRVPQEMAFRLMAVFLKMMLLPRIVMGTELMLPSWVATNAEGVLREGMEGKGKAEKKASEEEKGKKE